MIDGPTINKGNKNMNATQYNNPHIGCYFDGCHGQTYNDIRVLRLALQYGWQDAEASIFAGERELTDGQHDTLSEIADEAIEYLNSLENRSFLSWQWNDGDFGLYPSIESAQEDCEFVSSKTNEYPPDDYRGEWLHVNDHGNATLYVRGDNAQDVEVWSVV